MLKRSKTGPSCLRAIVNGCPGMASWDYHSLLATSSDCASGRLRRWATYARQIWHRDPTGRWTFYASAACQVACTGYFGADVERVREGPIELEWEPPHRLRLRTADGPVDWEIAIGATVETRVMNPMGSMMPLAGWRSGPVLSAMGAVAGRFLGVGKVQLTGTTSNRQHFDANPMHV